MPARPAVLPKLRFTKLFDRDMPPAVAPRTTPPAIRRACLRRRPFHHRHTFRRLDIRLRHHSRRHHVSTTISTTVMSTAAKSAAVATATAAVSTASTTTAAAVGIGVDIGANATAKATAYPMFLNRMGPPFRD